jgi:hypothetical protein
MSTQLLKLSLIGAFFTLAIVACSGGDAEGTAPCGELREGASLGAGESVTSCNGTHKFINQADGNVVLYHSIGTSGGVPRWASDTVGKHGTLKLEAGNLRLVDASGSVLFESATANNPGARFVMQDDGNGVIYDTNQYAVWSTGTVISGSSSSSGGSNGGCTSDSDCHDKCKRCVRSSGSCVSRLSC